MPKPVIKVVETPPPSPSIVEETATIEEPKPIKVVENQILTEIEVPEESWYETFTRNNPDLEKFIGENLVSKIGVAVLVIGIAFFVKYAIDENWINEIARVGIGLLCGGIILGFAHRLHEQFKDFSSVLVAGGISIFYFTISIAFHQYHLFGQPTAFALMVAITAFMVFISVLYDRQELAALSLIGGFSAPFMVSTGAENYQVLFGYILILDIGMLVLAYWRKWNYINLISYGFTWLLYTAWLQTKVIGAENAPYLGAFVFATIYYVLFMVANVVNNIKARRPFETLDLSLIISNTFLFFGFGVQILHLCNPNLQGLFCVSLAAFNCLGAWLLYKQFNADNKLIYLMIGLTLTFVTLTAPMQLHGNYITLFWAFEGVLLMWLAQKSNIVLYRFTSVLVTVLMFISLAMDWTMVYNRADVLLPIVLNECFITGFVSSLCILLTAWLLRTENESVEYLGVWLDRKSVV